MTTPEVKWVDAPAINRRGSVSWADQAKALRPVLDSRPGQWAEIKRYRGVTSAGAAAKHLREALGDGYEVRGGRLAEGGGSGLYARSTADPRTVASRAVTGTEPALRCDDCGAAFPADEARRLEVHVVQAHKRGVHKVERQPRRAAEAAS